MNRNYFVVFGQHGIDGSEIVQRFAVFIETPGEQVWNTRTPRLRMT